MEQLSTSDTRPVGPAPENLPRPLRRGDGRGRPVGGSEDMLAGSVDVGFMAG